jgi:serine/threonine protein phosphatase PrpC
VPYVRLAEVLGRDHAPDARAAALVADSLQAGGQDNATAVVIEVR